MKLSIPSYADHVGKNQKKKKSERSYWLSEVQHRKLLKYLSWSIKKLKRNGIGINKKKFEKKGQKWRKRGQGRGRKFEDKKRKCQN